MQQLWIKMDFGKCNVCVCVFVSLKIRPAHFSPFEKSSSKAVTFLITKGQ